MKNANWAEWSIKHRQIIYFFAALIFLTGIYAFSSLGRSEDPSFTVKQMVISAAWPGATAKEVEQHVTDEIEKQAQTLRDIDKITSYSRPGVAVVNVYLKDDVASEDVRQHWFDLRNLIGDIKGSLPEGVLGPYFNDHFDDVYGNIYALTGKNYSYEEMRRAAEKIKLRLSSIPDVKKIELIGVQEEKIFIQADTEKLARLGLDINAIAAAVQAQTAVTPAGMLETKNGNAYLRLTGSPDALENIAAIPINANGKILRLQDLAVITRSYADPPESKMYFNGQPAVGIAISMEDGGNNIALGENLALAVSQIKKELPLGLELNQVANQPEVVKNSIAEFSRSLYEAIIIVLAVSLMTLGRRCGYVISCCIPLILLGAFTGMYILGIDLHKVSLGALVLSLGMLVDDAIVVVELMELKMSEGWERLRAASYAFKTCARPLLTGTVITCLGFMPIAFSKAQSSEFAFSLFPVMALTLLTSWLVSATLAPVLGYAWIKPTVIKENNFDSAFYRVFRSVLDWSLTHRVTVIAVTVAATAFSLFMLQFVKKEFFPPSVRPELLVELNLPEGSSIKATDAAAAKLTRLLKDDEEIESIATYVGESAPRFVLVFDPVQPRENYAQLVVVTKNAAARERTAEKINLLAAQYLPEAQCFSRSIPLGPPSPYPVMLRVTAPTDELAKRYAQKVRQTMDADPNVTATRTDWLEQTGFVQLVIDNDKLMQMGLSRQSVANALQAQISGYTVGSYLEGDQEIDLVFRLTPVDRADITSLETVAIPTSKGAVPLAQIARIAYGSENNMIWRRNIQPTITVSGNIAGNVTGNDVTQRVYDNLQEMRSSLPDGVKIEIDGALETSNKTLRYLAQPVPAMLVLMAVLLMLQLQDARKLFVIFCTAPMGIIGVIFGLLLFNSTLGFMAELGILALIGIIIRNSVVLIDQIQQHLDEGWQPLEAVREAAIVRFRPIMLAALTTVLGLIPMFPNPFWNALAVAIACGLTGATVLTLIVMPVIYAAVFKIK